MKPFLDRELQEYALRKHIPFDLPKALLLLLAVWMLKDSPFPIKLSVGLFRAAVNASPHPDDRAGKDLLDPDEVREGDASLTSDQLLAIRADLEANNAGLLEKLPSMYPELYGLTS